MLERHAEAKHQSVPLGGVVGPSVEPLDILFKRAIAQLDRAGSRYWARTLPASVEVDGGQRHYFGSILPTAQLRRRQGPLSVGEADPLLPTGIGPNK